jgi:MFS family permease
VAPNLTKFLFLNVGHFLTHLLMLLYPTVVLALQHDWQRPYAELIALSLPGFIAYAAGALPAGWLADRWSRKGVLAIFFIGIGAAAILTGFARTPIELATGLGLIGLFASIYHPVGIAMVVEGRDKVGKALGINGVWGNLGVAFAALVAGALSDWLGWRYAFVVPGALALAVGLCFVALVTVAPATRPVRVGATTDGARPVVPRSIFFIIAIGTLGSGLVFNASTVSMPKLFEDGIDLFQGSLATIGIVISSIMAVAAFAQIGIGLLIDRFPVKPIWLALLVIEVPLLVLVGVGAGAGLLVVAIPLMFVILGEAPIQDMLVARYASEAWRSRVYAVKFVLAISTAAATVPLIAGFHDATNSLLGLYALLAGITLICAGAAVFLPGRLRLRRLAERTAQPAE